MSASLLSMLSLLRLQAVIFLLAIYTSVKPSSAASDPSGAINKREDAIESTDPQSVRGTQLSDMTTLALDVPRDTRGAHGGHRRKNYYSSRRIYRRRHLHAPDSHSSLDSPSSSQSVSDSDEMTGRRSKSSAKRNQKHDESVYSQIRDLHNKDEEEKWQYGYMPIRRGDLVHLLRIANHSAPELGLANVFVVDANLIRDVALLSNASGFD